ncbi:MAG: exodeoxyribonuclease VII large subunit [Pseudomonadota bacterium]
MQEPLELPPQREILTVSQLNRAARAVLEGSFPLIWVEGEISNLAKPSSGHLYFTLKDEAASVRCAMFRNRNLRLGFIPANGIHVVLRAQVSLYEGRGEFQLIAEHMEEAGAGALRRAFELLKQRLAGEGLFDAAHKKPLPALPRCIGVVTSPSGAAIRDILTVLKRRFPAIPVVIYPAQVQGTGAAAQIAQALRTASRRKDCDVLIVARGGGSLEDLWAFNEEAVARAIHACELPVVTGIGHEIDFTIADFAADRRTATPSAAAELVSPDQAEWLQQLARQRQRLTARIRDRLERKHQTLDWLERRQQQQHPGSRLRAQAQRLDELEGRLHQARRGVLRHKRMVLSEIVARLHRHIPLHRLAQLQIHHENLRQRLHAMLRLTLERKRQRLDAASRALDAVSPLATLGRGYAIVRTLPEQRVLRDAREATPGGTVEARLAHGRLICQVAQALDE